MRKPRRKRAVRKVDRLLGRSDDDSRRVAESFGWTYSLEHPSKSDAIQETTRKSPLPRTRE